MIGHLFKRIGRHVWSEVFEAIVLWTILLSLAFYFHT